MRKRPGIEGDPLKVVLAEAFKVKNYQIAGPSWLDQDCFEIVAKMPEGATSDQIPAMLHALLVERFKLAARKEDRPRPLVFFRAAPDARGFKGAMTMAGRSPPLHIGQRLLTPMLSQGGQRTKRVRR